VIKYNHGIKHPKRRGRDDEHVLVVSRAGRNLPRPLFQPDKIEMKN
jgi:hypothetical protein